MSSSFRSYVADRDVYLSVSGALSLSRRKEDIRPFCATG